MIAKTRATDEAEDEELGEARGDELPEQLRTAGGRREFFRQARAQLRREEQSLEPADEPEAEASEEVPLRLDAEEIVGRGRQAGMPGCGRASASSSSTAGRTRIRSRARARSGCCWRPSGWSQVLMSSAAPTRPTSTTGQPRATGWAGRPGGRAEPYRPPEVPAGKLNITDPDSKPIPVGFGFVQGYNAQTAVNEQQIVLAAEITNASTDFLAA